MDICYYCGDAKPDSEFSLEHIWPDALGGDYLSDIWKTRRVCGKCNSLMGLFVDGAFIKSWFVTNERSWGAEHYIDPADAANARVPLCYMGRLNSDKIAKGEMAEYWAGPCGANIIHIHPHLEEETWDTFSGGHPKKSGKRSLAGRVYVALTSEDPFWIIATLISVKAHFKKADLIVTNMELPPTARRFVELDRSNPDHVKDLPVVDPVITAGQTDQSVNVQMAASLDLGSRFLCKIALGIGSQLLGEDFVSSPYANVLRSGLWERNAAKRQSLPVKGQGFHGQTELGDLEKRLSRPGAWSLLLIVTQSGLALSSGAPSGRTMTILVCDDPILIAQLDQSYEVGQYWVTVPVIKTACGPLALPDVLAHVTKTISNTELQALDQQVRDPNDLPPCTGTPDPERRAQDPGDVASKARH